MALIINDLKVFLAKQRFGDLTRGTDDTPDKTAFLDPEINWTNFKSIAQKFPLLYFSYVTSHEQIFLLLLYKNTFFVKKILLIFFSYFLFFCKKRKKNSAKKSLHNPLLCTKISYVNCLIISNNFKLICMTINFSNVRWFIKYG